MTTALLPYLFILPPLLYQLLALLAVRAFFAREKKAVDARPRVSIIKPLKGLDTESRLNLESFCLQDYPECQIIFVLQSAEDPIIPVIRTLMADYPHLDLELVINATVHGANGKVTNLINAYARAKHDIIVLADSDIRVQPDFLKNITAHFSLPAVGLVTSLYRGVQVHGAASAIEALGFSVDMMPNVIVAARLEGLTFALGAATAVRRQALESIGGFSSLADYLADDYQLGNMIKRAGWQLVLSRDFVESVMPRESLADVLARQLRWCRTMRVSRPFGYLASGITQPFLAVVLSFAVAGFTLPACAALLLLYLVRAASLIFLNRSFVKDGLLPRYLWLLPIRDWLALITWGLAFTGNRVTWRGAAYILGCEGKMIRSD